VENHDPPIEAPAAVAVPPPKGTKPTRKRQALPPPSLCPHCHRSDSPYLNVAEAAALLRCTKRALYRLAERESDRLEERKGGVPLLPGLRRFGGRLLIRRADLVRSIEKGRVPADSDGETQA
jgi:hypothetical protein